MSDSGPATVTRLLEKLNAGDETVRAELVAAVQTDLRAIAAKYMRQHFGKELPGMTLQPTALVNEAYLPLIKQRKRFDNRGHFFAIATKVLIRVLKDYQKARTRQKRGGKQIRISLDPERGPMVPDDAGSREIENVEAVAAALEKLERLDARKAEVVKLHVLWGLKIEEVAKTLGVSGATVERDWQFARAWLGKELGGERTDC